METHKGINIALFEPSWSAFQIPALVVVALGLLALLKRVYRIHFHPLNAFPGPKEACASDKWLYKASKQRFPEEDFEKLHEEYGTKALRIGPNELHITDIHLYKTIYSQTKPFPKEENFYDGFNTPHTLFAETNSALHKQRRKLLNPMFSRQGVFKLEPIMQEKVALLLEKIDRLAPKGPVNVYDAFRSLTTEVIMEFAFAKSGELINEEPEGFGSWFLRGFDVASKSILDMQFSPLLRYMAKILPRPVVRKLNPEVGMILDIHTYAESSMRHWQKNGNTTSHPVVFDRLEELSDSDKIYEAIDILIAGADTTASTLTTGFSHILSQPAVYHNLLKALETVQPDGDGKLRLAELEKCDYLNAVVKECIRIGMAVPGRLPRKVPEGDPFVVDGKVVPRGTIVGISTYTMHTSEEAWGPDAREFNPDRWLGPDSNKLEQWMCTFSKGARMCIGQNVAPAEIILVLGYLFTRYRPHLLEGYTAPLRQDVFTLTYPGGLEIAFAKK